jgi:hypothetical protein
VKTIDATPVKRRHESADGLPSRELFRPTRRGGPHAWKRWAALVGLAGAPVSGALSACAYLMAYLLGASQLTRAGDVLIIAVLPLLILGAVALDWLEDDFERVGAEGERITPKSSNTVEPRKARTARARARSRP